MTHVLLTGAGFSRNWGGWLADEAFEYLLGCPEINGTVRDLLWEHKNKGGGFEDALAYLEQEHERQGNERSAKPLADLRAALAGMLNSMTQAFDRTPFEPQNDVAYLVRSFLVRFDAIFTLNQDLLLERHYLDDNIALSSIRRWTGWHIPGMKLQAPQSHDSGLEQPAARVPDPSDFKIAAGFQPYFKLHGSVNWTDDVPGGRLLIMGGNKFASIHRRPVLTWYHEKFAEHLSRGDARLMVIGYSFGDQHINDAINEAASKRGLRLFIIDPRGVDVLVRSGGLTDDRMPLQELGPHIVGASRRPLTATFGTDRVEFSKVMRFFEA